MNLNISIMINKATNANIKTQLSKHFQFKLITYCTVLYCAVLYCSVRTSLVTVGILDPASFIPLGNGIEGGMSEEFSGVSTEPMVGMFFLRATFFG